MPRVSLAASQKLESEGLSMRKTSCLPRLWIFSLSVLLFSATLCLGQNREKFVISAKAGGINAVTGQASVVGKGEAEWQQLMVTDDLDAGDRVKTASDGRVEILLNPGSYLRVGGNSEIELANNSLENLEVRLLRGTAIVEATGGEGTELVINISTPHARLAIVRQGLYRFNVVPGDNTELIVRKGRVILNDSHTKVKGGNKVVFSATNVSVAKLTDEEKKNKEEVEVWSKDRAKSLAQANSRISNRMLTSAFRDSDPFYLGASGRSGIWFFNTRASCYTFLPFYYGWGSPYGGSYSTSIFGSFTGPGYRQPTMAGYPTNSASSASPVGAPAAPAGSPSGAAAPGRVAMPTAPDGGRVIPKLDRMSDPSRPQP
jgi:hypothetical protein